MSQNSDPLGAYRISSEESDKKKESTLQENDPLKKYRTDSSKKSGYRDVVSEELRAAGHEPDISEELERASSLGGAEAIRGILSGATFGATKAVPGLRPQEGGATSFNEAVGSTLLPIGGAIKAGKAAVSPLVRLASKSPRIQKAISSLGHLTGISALGATGGAIHEATEDEKLKMPSVETALEHGATWAVIDAALQGLGYSGRFAKALLSKSRSTGKDKVSLLNDTLKQAEKVGGSDEKVAETALNILEKKPEIVSENLSEKLANKKIEVKDLTKLKHIPPKPYLPGEFQFTTSAESAINSDLQSSIDLIGERAASEKQLGENIQRDLEAQIESKKQEVDDLYTIASEGEEYKNVDLRQTAESIFNQLQKIQKGGIKLSPEGYSKAEKQLVQAIEDVGYSVVYEQDGKTIKELIKTADVSLSKAVEIKKRLNKIIDYELKETGAQDFLKDPTSSLRGDIRRGYGSKDSPQRIAFEKAEKLHGENSQKTKKKSVVSSRYSEKPESIASLIKTPSGLHDLKQTVSPAQFKQIEREVVEHINSLSEEKAKSFYREIRSDLSSDAKIVAEEIIESKAPANASDKKQMQRMKIQDSVLEDISKASITGDRPEKALNLWKTREGQQIIKHSLQDNPHKKQILKYLSETSFNDFSTSVINPAGEINFKKLTEFMKDPATTETIRMVAGEEGVNFLKNLEKISEEAKKNFSVIEGIIDKGSASERAKIEKSLSSKPNRFTKHQKLHKENLESKNKLLYKLDDFMKSYGIKAKGLIALLGIYKFGTLETIGAGVAYEAFKFLVKNKKVRQAARQAAAPRSNPVNSIKAYEAISKASED